MAGGDDQRNVYTDPGISARTIDHADVTAKIEAFTFVVKNSRKDPNWRICASKSLPHLRPKTW